MADYTPVSDDLPWCMVPEKKITDGGRKIRPLLPIFRAHPMIRMPPMGMKGMRGAYRSIGINRNDFLSVIQMRPEQKEDHGTVEWVAFASNAFNVLAAVLRRCGGDPGRSCPTRRRTCPRIISTGCSRLIAAMADASY